MTEPATTSQRTRRPPAVVVVALILLVPAMLTWLVAGVAFLRATSESTVGLVLFGIPGGGFCLLLAVLGAAGIRTMWRGQRAGCTAGVLQFSMIPVIVLMILAWARSLAPGRRTGTVRPMEFETTMWVPIVLAALQVTAILLLSLPSARAWFRPAAPPPSARGV